MVLHLASLDKQKMVKQLYPNPIALAEYLLKLMGFYYPNKDSRAMQNLSSYFLTGSNEAVRFKEFSSFLNFDNPILSYCRLITLLKQSGGKRPEIIKPEIMRIIYKVLLFIMKESLHEHFVSLRVSCPWLYLGSKESPGTLV